MPESLLGLTKPRGRAEPVHLMLADLGAAFQLAGLVLAAFAAGLGLSTLRGGGAARARTARRALYAATVMVGGASAVLVVLFLTDDFSVAYVYANSSRGLDVWLKVADFWGGESGSLLYWSLAIFIFGSIAVAVAARRIPELATLAGALVAAIAGFYLFTLVFVSSPFATLGVTPQNGLGLNPLLRDVGMDIHPPFELAGYGSFAIPFAFAMASLLARRYDAAWIDATRRVALISWTLLSTGLLLGMWWSYHVLGWGGYYSWDPVENVALIPWLVITAYLHSIQVQQRRGRLRAWNFGLVIAAFLLAVFGDFVVRSGIIPSVHAFAISGTAPLTLGFLAVCLLFSGTLLARSASGLRATQPMSGALSREGTFLLQNIIIVLLVAAVLWGVLLPLLTGALRGSQMVVSSPYYDETSAPLMALLLLLLAVGPLVPWRRVVRGSSQLSLGSWSCRLVWPAAGWMLTLAVLLLAGARSLGPLVALPLVAAGLATCLSEYVRGGRQVARQVRSGAGLGRSILRVAAANRSRYGAYLAHAGILVVAIGIVGSQFWQQELQVQVHPGQTVALAGYRLTYEGSYTVVEGDHRATIARLRQPDGTLVEPQRLVYPALGGSQLPRADIQSSATEDLYVVLDGVTGGGGAALSIFVNPLVAWIWVGGVILIVGVVLNNLGRLAASSPAVVRATEQQAAQQEAEERRADRSPAPAETRPGAAKPAAATAQAPPSRAVP
ncbi:MAG: heme lyase CcmF/NrfE family subunit [Candidatus Dormibacteraceae bacterium]